MHLSYSVANKATTTACNIRHANQIKTIMEPPTYNTAENWQCFGKAHRDFLVKYEQLRDILAPLLQEDSEILDICCGTSRLCV